jgi:hypothetical protein
MFNEWRLEEYLEWTGQRLVSAAPERETPRPRLEPDEVTRGYVRWCEHRRRPSNCFSLLTKGPSLDAEGRYTLAMAIATEAVWNETKEALAEMADPEAVRAHIVSAMAMYMLLWVLPEPASKGLAATLTAALIAYLGVDTVWGLMGGWVRLVDEVNRATTFEQLHAASERYGKVMGRHGARAFVLLATAAIGNTAGLAAKGPGLPGYSQAAVLAETQGGFRLAAVGQVRSVAVSADGSFTIALAPGAVAMTAQGSDKGTNHTTTRQQGGTTYRFNTGHAFNRAHKTGTDLRKTSLTPDDVETAIMSHLHTYRASGGSLPLSSNGAVPTPYMGQVTVRAHIVEFSAIQASNNTVFVGTYYLLP